jgi:hypothetical protein
MSTWCVECSCVSARLSPPAAGGSPPLLYIKGAAGYMRAALPSYVEKCDVLRCRVGGRPGDPRCDPVIMA